MKLLVRPKRAFPPAEDMAYFQDLLKKNGYLVIASDVEWIWTTFSQEMACQRWVDPREFSTATVLKAFETRLEAA